jgi:2-polyprenyl-3-methyl-5-hydroxy-6-metoxy-1,4-benzoquinol methylase
MKNEDNLLDASAKVFRDRISPGSRFQALMENSSRHASADDVPPDAAVEKWESDFDLLHTLRLSRSVESAAAQIGDMPPEPPTLRGRMGAILVQAVRRALFWYTGQVRAFQGIVAAAAGEQVAVVRELCGRQHRQQALLVDTRDRLNEFARGHERRWSEFEQSHDQRLGAFEREQEQRVKQLARDQELRCSEVELRQDERTRAVFEQISRQEQQVQEMRRAQDGWRDEMLRAQAAADEAEGLRRTVTASKLGQIDEALADIRRETEAQGREVRRQIQQERAQLVQQEFRLKMLLREVRKGPAESRPDVVREVAAEQLQGSNDALFVDHAKAFRGTRAEIKSRFAAYAAHVKGAFAKTGGAPALDLGCGQGEWLELLREMDIPASGIDWNHELVQACCEMGFDARQGDVPRMLAAVADESLSVVTAFHVLEHVAFPDLLEIIDQAVRILKPGGIAIFETPNPANLFVSSNNFYLDPTHRHPIPSDLLAFVVEARGFCDPKVMPLSPYPDHFRLPDSECPAVQFINDHFYGPQDYGIIGYKV